METGIGIYFYHVMDTRTESWLSCVMETKTVVQCCMGSSQLLYCTVLYIYIGTERSVALVSIGDRKVLHWAHIDTKRGVAFEYIVY
jgi:hypothetical protein